MNCMKKLSERVKTTAFVRQVVELHVPSLHPQSIH